MLHKLQEARTEFAARSLVYAMRSGASFDSALALVRSELGSEYLSTVEKMEFVFKEPEVPGWTDGRAQDTLRRLHRFLRCLDENPTRTSSAQYFDLAQSVRPIHDVLIAASNRIYRMCLPLGLVAVIACVVAMVYLIFVLPQFQQLYAGLGAQLPAFTEMVLASGHGWIVLTPLLLTVALSLAAMTMLSRDRASRWVRFERFAQAFGRRDGIAGETRRMNFVWWIDALCAAGVSLPRAIVSAARESMLDMDASDQPTDRQAKFIAQALMVANNLNALESELQSQWNARQIGLAASLAGFEATIGIIFRLFIYSAVGALVIAMYLPIFKLGAAI